MESILQALDSVGVLTLTLNRPDKLNALNRDTLIHLHTILQQAKRDTQVRGLLITGTGKAFCAGADIQELATCDALSGYDFACLGQTVFETLETLGKPSIALVNGLALGGGAELIQAATMRFAATNAKFGQPEIKLNIMPGFGGTQRLARLIGKGRALDLCLTGRMIDAATALSWGLVSEVLENELLMERGRAVLHELLQRSPVALESIMSVIQHGFDLPLVESLHLEALHFSKVCATQEKNEGLADFLDKRTLS